MQVIVILESLEEIVRVSKLRIEWLNSMESLVQTQIDGNCRSVKILRGLLDAVKTKSSEKDQERDWDSFAKMFEVHNEPSEQILSAIRALKQKDVEQSENLLKIIAEVKKGANLNV